MTLESLMEGQTLYAKIVATERALATLSEDTNNPIELYHNGRKLTIVPDSPMYKYLKEEWVKQTEEELAVKRAAFEKL